MRNVSLVAAATFLATLTVGAQSASAGTVVVKTSLDNVILQGATILDFNASDPNYSSFDPSNLATSSTYAPVSPNPITIGQASVTFDPGAYLATGNIGGVVAAPIVGQAAGADTNAYIAAEPNANVSLTFNRPQADFELLWGSIDSYNGLTFYNCTNVCTQVISFTGADISNTPDGLQSYGGSSYVNFQFTGASFNKVVASSTSPAFEFGYVSSVAAGQPVTTTDAPGTLYTVAGVPEPAVWAGIRRGARMFPSAVESGRGVRGAQVVVEAQRGGRAAVQRR